MHRLASRSSALVAAFFLVAGYVHADDHPDVQAGIGLLKAGDETADKGKPNDAQLRYKEAIEKILPRLRGIPWKHEVKRDVTPREKMQEMLIKEFEEDMTPAEFEGQEKAFKAFGMLPADLDL